MAKLNEEALNHETKAKLSNVADLQSVSTDLEVLYEKETEFPYSYIIVDGVRYRIPGSVFSSLKAILEENKDLKKFKVKKTGEGMETKYVVIPLS